MIRSHVTTSFALLSALLFAGCAGKTALVAEEVPAPTITEKVPAPTVTEPVAEPVSIENVISDGSESEAVAAAPQMAEAVAPEASSDEPLVPPPSAMELADGSAIVEYSLGGETAQGLERVYFEFDQSTLTPQARDILSKNAQYLEQNPETRIRIEGHCDERGASEYNLALGDRRARSALQYLTDLGIAPDRIRTVSYGKEMPIDPGHTENAWAKNRRAEFIAIGN